MQALANIAFSWQAVVGHDLAWLTFAITVENFTSAIGTVIFVAYLSALYSPINSMFQTWGIAQTSTVGVRRVFDLLRRPIDHRPVAHVEDRRDRSSAARIDLGGYAIDFVLRA